MHFNPIDYPIFVLLAFACVGQFFRLTAVPAKTSGILVGLLLMISTYQNHESWGWYLMDAVVAVLWAGSLLGTLAKRRAA